MVDMTALDDGFDMNIEGEGADRLQADRDNLIARAAQVVWERLGQRPPGLRVKAANGIPLSSGLGSSAAATLSGLLAANALSGDALSRLDLLQLAHRIEGHPDNAAAALFGGLTLISADGRDPLVQTLEVPPIAVAVALPDVRLSTHEARKALPARVPLSDAVFNIGRALFVARALQAGDFDLLGRAMDDRLHQPYRRKLIPGFDAAEGAAREAGAAAVALSGAGPSLIAFAPDRHAEIAQAMKIAFGARSLQCRTFVLPVDQHGARVELIA